MFEGLWEQQRCGAIRSVTLVLVKDILTESRKSPASIAKSNKQWVGDLLVSGGVQAPSDKLRSSYSVMSK